MFNWCDVIITHRWLMIILKKTSNIYHRIYEPIYSVTPY